MIRSEDTVRFLYQICLLGLVPDQLQGILAARILNQWFAIQGDWGTHYDAPPPGFPVVPPMARWLWTGVLPQMTIWIAWTVVVGMLFGAFGWVVAERRAE